MQLNENAFLWFNKTSTDVLVYFRSQLEVLRVFCARCFIVRVKNYPINVFLIIIIVNMSDLETNS